MTHKHEGHHDHKNATKHAGESDTNPLRVKLVSGDDEGAPKSCTLKSSADCEQEPSEWWGNPHWWIAILTFILAFFAMGSFVLLRIQVNDARELFGEDQRPYVWYKTGDGNVSAGAANVNTPFVITALLQNYGKSPALVTRYALDGEIGPKATSKLHKGMWIYLKSVLPPGKFDPYKIPDGMLTADNKEIILGEDGFAGYIIIQYTDTGQHPYESDLCFSHAKDNPTFLYCPERNEIKDCEKDACEL